MSKGKHSKSTYKELFGQINLIFNGIMLREIVKLKDTKYKRKL